MNVKRSLMVGATVATIGLGGLAGSGMAAADSASTSGTSLVDTIASKFNLNKDEVQAVFDADRATREAEREAEQKERLAQAVTDGKLTQERADYITTAQKDIQTLMGDTKPGDQDDATREAIRTKMDALRTWADGNNVDMQYVGHGGRGHGGFGGPGERDANE